MFLLQLIIGPMLRWIFRASKDSAASVRKDVIAAVKFVFLRSGAELKEFFSAAPMVIMFIRHLYVNRSRLRVGEDAMVIGGALALGSILTVAAISILIAAPVQLAISLVHPIAGASLVFATGGVVSSVVVFLVWILFYSINKALSDSPNYIDMRAGYGANELARASDEFVDAIRKADVQVDGIVDGLIPALRSRVVGGDLDFLDRKIRKSLDKGIVMNLTDFPKIDVCSIEERLPVEKVYKRMSVREMRGRIWKSK